MRGTVAKSLRGQSKLPDGTLDRLFYRSLKRDYKAGKAFAGEPKLEGRPRYGRSSLRGAKTPFGIQAINEPSRRHPLRKLGGVFGFLPPDRMRAALTLEKKAGTLAKPELQRRVDALVAQAQTP